MKTLLVLLLAFSQPLDESSVLAVTGASSIEELSSEVLERLESLRLHPIDVNSSSDAALRESGLFSDYQAASIRDYIDRCGEICSFAELSSINGIGAQYAEALRPYVIIEAGLPPGERRSNASSFHLDSQLRLSWKGEDVLPAAKIEARSQRISASAAVNSDGLRSAGLSYSSARDWKIIAGSFHARFGQGLLQWSGFRMSGYSTVASLSLSPTGITRALSYGESLTGVAGELSLRRIRFSAFVSAGDAVGIDGTLTLQSSTLSLSLVHTSAGFVPSVSGRATLGRVTLLGECTTVSACAGAFYNLGYRKRAGLRLGVSPDVKEVAAGCQFRSAETVATFVDKQGVQRHRYVARWTPAVSFVHISLKGELRVQETYRPRDTDKWRSEMRAALTVSVSKVSAGLRADAVVSRGFGWYTHFETGWNGRVCAYLRASVFDVKDWADRIYVYERDVPGVFNVPAYYGTGWHCCALARWKWLSFRIGYTSYPGTPGKEPRFETRLQADIRI